MFGKKCDCCGGKIPGSLVQQIPGGVICPHCVLVCSNALFTPLEQVKQAWAENHTRFQDFKETMVYHYTMAGFIHVDTEHQYAYFARSKKLDQEPIVFKFSEVEGYRLERKGEKTVTKTKGGTGRSVVGGAFLGSPVPW